MSKTLVIEYQHEVKRVQVPDTATVTFGGLIPGAKSDGGSNRTAVRIYGPKKEQLAVFTGATGFRFMEQISVLEKKVNHATKQVAVNEDGMQKVRSVTVTTEDWVNPDSVQQSESTNEAQLQALKLEV